MEHIQYTMHMIDLVVEKTPPSGLSEILNRGLTLVMQHYDVVDKEITLVLVDDETIRKLKREYWGEDAPTDVLSFPNWEPDDPFMPPHLGDVIISLDTAERQAKSKGHSLTYEVVLLASHGLVHLLGYDHPHASGLGYEEGATGEEWEVFHHAWQLAKQALGKDSAPTTTTAT